MERQGFRSPPVRVDEEIDVKIEAVGEKGDGIAKKNGFVLFVPGVKEGDEVRIKITKVLRKVGFAEVVGAAQGKVESSAKPAKQHKEESGESDGSGQFEEAPESEEDTEDFGEEIQENQG